MAQTPTSSAKKATAEKSPPESKSGKADKAQDSAEKRASKLAEKLETAKAAKADLKKATAGATAKPDKDKNTDAVRRPAQPARKHVAANDDLPSIGGLIYALQQRPSRSSFVFAFAASLVWLVLGGAAGWAMMTAGAGDSAGIGNFMQQPTALVAAATIIVPIALFWFLALLIWRAQELRLMASAMTEVAVRLAEPDKLAEQSVASLGQTIRRQVAAMNDAITRALGRAGELEALVHNEVAALENSYGENELRIRRLIDELSSEREALANNSERVSETLRGVGSQVAKDISIAGDQATKALASSTATIADSLTVKSGKITAAMAAAGSAIDNKLAERGVKFAETINDTSRKVGDAIDVKANSLFQTLTSVSAKLSADVPNLLQRLDGEQNRLNEIISAANKNFTALETAIADRTTKLDATLQTRGDELKTVFSQNAAQIDTKLQKRGDELKTVLSQNVAQIDTNLQKRGDELKTVLSQNAAQMNTDLQKRTEDIKVSLAERIKALDSTVRKQAESIEQSLTKNTMALNQAFAEGSDAVKRSSAQMAKESNKATENMNAQAAMLKDVSNGLVGQIHNVTQRFEKQGTAIMSAANALDSSNAKIDSILERRHSEISSLMNMVASKAQDLDKMMRSYTGIIENSLVQVESRAKDVSSSLIQDSTSQSQTAIAEIERLRNETRAQTNKAVEELQSNFQSISTQISDQLGSLSQQFGKTTTEMRTTASQTASEIETTRRELQRRMQDLPKETRQNTEMMRKAVSDQLRALDSLTSIAADQQQTRPPVSSPTAPAQIPQALGAPQNGNGAQPGSKLPVGGGTMRPSDHAAASSASGQSQPPAASLAPFEERKTDNLASVTNTLAQRLGGLGQASASSKPPEVAAPAATGVRITGSPPPAAPPTPPASPSEQWSVGDLLARASEPDNRGVAQPPQAAPAPAAAPAGDIRLNDLARAIDHNAAADVWHRFRRGERNVLSRQLYTHEGQVAFDEISGRYNRDPEFHATVDRYIGDFERLLAEADSKGQDAAVMQNYLTSETGRVYLMLAHASGRLQ